MRNFWDQTGGLWMKGALVGKVGIVFTSTATQHGGQETTILTFIPTLLHQGMVVVGLPYAFAGQMGLDEIKGGSPYGASTIAGGEGEPPAIRAASWAWPASRASTSPASRPSSRAERPSLLRIQEAPVRKDRGFLLLQVRRVSLIAFRQPVSSLRDHGRDHPAG